jgi:hypothetical protein
VEGTRQTTAPIMPPLAPPQPSWKQELKHEKPEGSAAEGPKSGGEPSGTTEPNK